MQKIIRVFFVIIMIFAYKPYQTNAIKLSIRIMTNSNVVVEGGKLNYIKLDNPLPMVEIFNDNTFIMYKVDVIDKSPTKQTYGVVLSNDKKPVAINFHDKNWKQSVKMVLDNWLELYVEGQSMIAISFCDTSAAKEEQVLTRTYFTEISERMLSRSANKNNLVDGTIIVSKLNFESLFFRITAGKLTLSSAKAYNPDVLYKNKQYSVGVSDLLGQHQYQYLDARLSGYLCLYTNSKKVILQGCETEFNDKLIIKNSTAMVSLYDIFKKTNCAIAHDTNRRVWDIYTLINENLSKPVELIHIQIFDGSNKYLINGIEHTFSEFPEIDHSYGWNYTSLIPLKDALKAIKMSYYYRFADKSFLIQRFR